MVATKAGRALAIQVLRLLIEKRVMRLVDRSQLIELVGDLAELLSEDRK